MIGIVLVQAALAAQVALQVDSDELREGQSVRLDLVVVDAVPRAVPRLAVPDGLEISYRNQSQQRQIINFQSTSSTTFSYTLTALRAGAYDVGPVSVATDAGELTTAPLRLNVAARTSDGAEALVGDIGVNHAWVGQVLIYHLRFQTEKNVVSGRWTPPTPPGFTVEPTVEALTSEYRLEQDGKPLAIQELYFPLRASAPGKWTISGGVLQAQYAVTENNVRRRRNSPFEGIGAFGNVRNEVYSSPPLDVVVRELPTEGRPPDATELVGRFTLQARTSEGTARVGDTVTVEVVIEGDGVLAGFSLPSLAGDAFRVYDDQPIVESRIEDGKYHAKATFKRAIVPQAPGKIHVPPIEIAYFDPVDGAWARVSTKPIHLDVGGEATGPDVKSWHDGGAPRTVDALGEDILPVRTDVRLARPVPRPLALALVAPGAVVLALQGLLALRGRKPRIQARALGFDDLPADAEARLAGVERIFRERVARRLGVEPEALRREDLAALGPAADEAETIYRALERRRYGGQDAGVSEERIRALVEGWA